MLCRKFGLIFALVGSLTLLSACGTTSSNRYNPLAQELAFQRWQHCLQTQEPDRSVNPVEELKLIAFYCDGHKRDLIAAFPRHLERQISGMLTQSTREIVTQRLIGHDKLSELGVNTVISMPAAMNISPK